MAARDIVVVGASAGGVETIPRFFKGLDDHVPATFFVVMHLAANVRSYLPTLIQRATRHFTVKDAVHDKRFERGSVYVAPPDHHLLLESDRIRLSHGPKENRHRPAIDPLFRTAATHHGPRVIGILLTGTLDDGSVGLREIKRLGGLTMVQDPSEAVHPEMPMNAIALAKPDFCLNVGEMGSMLPDLIKQAIPRSSRKNSADKGMKPENVHPKSLSELGQKLGAPSGLVCPECSGPLWQIQKQDALHYRCMVGHAYSPENFIAAQSDEVERALWICLRALEQRIELQHKLATRSQKLSQSFTAKSFLKKAQENERHARLIRKMLEDL